MCASEGRKQGVHAARAVPPVHAHSFPAAPVTLQSWTPDVTCGASCEGQAVVFQRGAWGGRQGLVRGHRGSLLPRLWDRAGKENTGFGAGESRGLTCGKSSRLPGPRLLHMKGAPASSWPVSQHVSAEPAGHPCGSAGKSHPCLSWGLPRPSVAVGRAGACQGAGPRGPALTGGVPPVTCPLQDCVSSSV